MLLLIEGLLAAGSSSDGGLGSIELASVGTGNQWCAPANVEPVQLLDAMPWRTPTLSLIHTLDAPALLLLKSFNGASRQYTANVRQCERSYLPTIMLD